jgi:hypothetical protein
MEVAELLMKSPSAMSFQEGRGNFSMSRVSALVGHDTLVCAIKRHWSFEET